jgi:hypothetical protein
VTIRSGALRGAVICALVSLALFGASSLFNRPARLPPPLLDVRISLADNRPVSEVFLVPDEQRYVVALWFKKSETNLGDAVKVSCIIKRGNDLVAQGSKDRLDVNSGDRVGSELWSGSFTPGQHSLQIEVSSGSPQLLSASPRLLVALQDLHVGPPLGLIASACATLTGAVAGLVSLCFMVAWGIGKWQLSSP